jgi:hypothetical protein
MEQLIVDFKTYANSFGQGYLKTWKANGILHTLETMPQMFDDEVRFLAYLKNCLEMEGFRSTDIELIMGWLYERKDAL